MNKGKFNILGVLVNAINYESAIDEIVTAAKNKQSLGVSALAVHGVMTGFNREHRYRLNQLDIVVPDGQPVRWGLNILHKAQLNDRVYGPQLMLSICAEAERQALPIYLYGSRDEVLADLEKNLVRKFPKLTIAGKQPSRFRNLTQAEYEAEIESIPATGAQIVFVGLGCPRQETWVYEHLNKLPMPMIAVGAAFDFHAGLLPQAPPWMQKRGLEWFFRLLQEPRRLWRRYIYLNPIYLSLLFLQYLGIYVVDPEDSDEPHNLVLFG